MEEFHYHRECSFVTLTFSEENLLKYRLLAQEELKDEAKCDIYLTDNTAAKIAIRHYLERVRKRTGKSIKHWFITERGHTNTRRIHIHGIIWASYSQHGRGSNRPGDLDLTKEWKNGWTFNGEYVGEKTITYISKYITKNDRDNIGFKGKICCSSGIGKEYILSYNGLRNKFRGKKTIETYRLSNGKEIGLPMYYRNKIYTEAERERLWMQLLDKEERWVLGKKIDISHNGIWKWDNAAEEGRRISKNAGYKTPDFATNKWKKEYFKRNNFVNLKICCNIAALNINNQNAWSNDKSKIQLENRRFQEAETNGHLLQNLRHDGYHENWEGTHDDLGNGCSGNEIQKRFGPHRTDTNMEAGRIEKTTIDNINIYKNGNAGTNNSNRTGYEVVDIDTGEIYTKVEYTRIKNQLKTIGYEKKSRKGTRADGSKYTWYETKRFVRKIGKDQFEMEL